MVEVMSLKIHSGVISGSNSSVAIVAVWVELAATLKRLRPIVPSISLWQFSQACWKSSCCPVSIVSQRTCLVISAVLSTRTLNAGIQRPDTASCRSVLPLSFRTFEWAPKAMRRCIISIWLALAAQCKAVEPSSACVETLMPSWMMTLTRPMLPADAACIKVEVFANDTSP